ncbi:MAG: cell division protein FtsQ/DivIB [Pseudomonadota bacterium]
MRSLILREARRDPAPSRLRYRLARWWLRPHVRLTLTVLVPALLVLSLAGHWLMRAQTQQMLRETAVDLREALRARPEFMLVGLSVTGGSPALRGQVSEAVTVSFPVSSLALDLDQVRRRIEALSAVAAARVSVSDAGYLAVSVRERRPQAILRHNADLYLIGAEGHRVARLASRASRPDLPLLAGQGAEAAVPEALALMRLAAPVAARVRGLVRVGARRWDIVLDRDQRIMLPAEGAAAALAEVLALHRLEALLARDITHVDMRHAARPVLRLGPNALKRRHWPDAAVEAEET